MTDKRKPSLSLSGKMMAKMSKTSDDSMDALPQSSSDSKANDQISMSNPHVVKFFDSLHSALKTTRKHGLTKREAKKLLKSGLLTMNNGQLQVDTKVLATVTGKSAEIQPPVQDHPSNVSARRPDIIQQQQAEISYLRSTLTKERKARIKEDTGKKSIGSFFTSDKHKKALQQRITDLEASVSEKDRKIAQLEKFCNEYEDSLHDMEARETLTCQLTQKLQETIQSRESELHQCTQDLSKERNDKLVAERELSHCMGELQEAKQTIDRIEREKKILTRNSKANAERFQQQITQLEQYSQNQIQQLTKKLEEEELRRISFFEHKNAEDEMKRRQLLCDIESLTIGRNRAEERYSNTRMQLENLRCQFLASEDARKEIATRILQLQTNFIETLEEYERRLLLQRRENVESMEFTTKIESMIQHINEVILPLKEGSKKLSKSKKLLVQVSELTHNLQECIEGLDSTIRSQLSVAVQHEQKADDFLGCVNDIREKVNETLESCSKDVEKYYENEIEKLQNSFAVERNMFDAQMKQVIQNRNDMEAKLRAAEAEDIKKVDIRVVSEIQTRLENETKVRQKIQEENQTLLLKLNTLQVIVNDVETLKSEFDLERKEMAENYSIYENQQRKTIIELQEKLEKAEIQQLEVTKYSNELEKDINTLKHQNETLSQNTVRVEDVEIAVKQERQRANEKLTKLSEEIVELKEKLAEAERRAIAEASASELSSALDVALKENAELSARLANLSSSEDKYPSDILVSKDIELNNGTTKDIELNNGTTKAKVLASIPPPPPPIENLTSPRNSRNNLLSDIQNPEKVLLKRVDSPSPKNSRTDLMSEIRQGSSLLKPVASRTASDNHIQVQDPQNMLQVLAKVLSARREDIDDSDDDSDDESWDA